jgi:hypothetical protein
MNLVGMKRREQTLIHIKTLQPQTKFDLEQDVFQQMVTMTLHQKEQNKAVEHLSLLLDILQEAYIEAASADFKNTKTIKLLENRLQNYPDIDYEHERKLQDLYK